MLEILAIIFMLSAVGLGVYAAAIYSAATMSAGVVMAIIALVMLKVYHYRRRFK